MSQEMVSGVCAEQTGSSANLLPGVAQILSGDNDGWEIFCDHLSQDTTKFVVKMGIKVPGLGSRQMAVEIVSKLYERFCEDPEAFQNLASGNIVGYTYSIAKNYKTSALREKKNGKRFRPLGEELGLRETKPGSWCPEPTVARIPRPDHALQTKQAFKIIEEAMEKLPETSRILFDMQLDGLPQREMAARLGKNEKQMGSELSRARVKFAGLVKDVYHPAKFKRSMKDA